MTDAQINQAIAKACGWTNLTAVHKSGKAPGANYVGVEFYPDWCNDLNAIHQAEMTLTSAQLLEYVALLFDACYEATIASSRQRAEAFLRTLGKWEEVLK